MKDFSIAIMQPYIFPYIGYFHLIDSVDAFISFDDVNFIKKGWINRNRILTNDVVTNFNLPIKEMSQNKKINESFIFDAKKSKEKIVAQIYHSYRKAPYFEENFEFLNRLVLDNEESISIYNTNILKALSSYLGIRTDFSYSSDYITASEGKNKIFEILSLKNAQSYHNAIGGMSLYSESDFLAKGINLQFIESEAIQYKQLSSTFQPYLSILDTLLNCGVEETKILLKKYKLIRNG